MRPRPSRSLALFVAFEGIDGAGKTTQVQLLLSRLEGAAPAPVVLHEPGGTPLGERLHDLLKHDPVPLTPEAELLLFAASRAQLVREVVRPALAEGRMVLSDRFSASTIAYQGYGRGLDLELVRKVQEIATDGIAPDLTVLLDVPVPVGLSRKRKQARAAALSYQLSLFDRSSYDRFEDESAAFYERVRQGYLRLAAERAEATGATAGGRWAIIDGTSLPEVVGEAVWRVLSPLVRP